MKIKQTRQVRLDELMKYVWNNNITRTRFEGKDCSIYVDDRGNFKVADEYSLCKSDLYTFTEEVEITEESTLNVTVVFSEHIGNKNYSTSIYDVSINELKGNKKIKFIYLQNEDGSIGELIWKDGKLI